MALTSARIIEAAFALVNQGGLENLTTRKLARELNIQGPSLYHHFDSMDQLIGEMAVDLMRRHVSLVEPMGDWEMWVRSFAHAGRAMALSCRDGARILTAAVPPHADRDAISRSHADYLMRHGFSQSAALEALGIFANFVVGWTLNEQNRRIWLTSIMDIDDSFQNCVETLVIGVRELRARPDGELVPCESRASQMA